MGGQGNSKLACSFIMAIIAGGLTMAEGATLSRHDVRNTFDTVKKSNVSAIACSDPPRGQCAFYADCLEAKYHCGPSGYPIGYGQKYCNKFVEDKLELSAAGQTWMLDTMECLQRALVPEATDGTSGSLANCNALEDKAFASHAKCYIDNGFCGLGLQDWLSIINIVNISTFEDSWEAAKEASDVVECCLKLRVC